MTPTQLMLPGRDVKLVTAEPCMPLSRKLQENRSKIKQEATNGPIGLHSTSEFD